MWVTLYVFGHDCYSHSIYHKNILVLISSKIVDLANFELDVLVFTSVAEVGPCRTFNWNVMKALSNSVIFK